MHYKQKCAYLFLILTLYNKFKYKFSLLFLKFYGFSKNMLLRQKYAILFERNFNVFSFKIMKLSYLVKIISN